MLPDNGQQNSNISNKKSKNRNNGVLNITNSFLKKAIKHARTSIKFSSHNGIRKFASAATAFMYYTAVKATRLIKRNILNSKFKYVRKVFFPVFCLLFFSFVVYSSVFFSVALKVTVDDQIIGYIENQYDYNRAVNDVEAEITSDTGDEFVYKKVPIFSYAIVRKGSITTEEVLFENVLDNAQNNLEQCFALMVDGKLAGTYPKEGPLLDMLDALKEPYQTDNPNEKIDFENDVQIVKGFFTIPETQTLDEIQSMFTEPAEEKYFTVKSASTLSSIALAHDMSRETLRSLNPDIDFAALKVGQEINVAKPAIDLSVKVLKTITYTVDIPFDVKSSKSNDYFEGTTKVVKAGVKGKNEITAVVTYINGSETTREIISTKNLSKPQTQETLVGTKPVAPSGTFMWPVPGRSGISSGYGPRWGGFHPAIDIPAPTGTTAVAADAGTVTTAGWVKGGLGNLVVVSHGNGTVTKYGHLSSIDVSVGQKVSKGQRVGGIGSTGNSTGSHLHFEIHINGNPQNPTKYLGR